MKRSNWTEQAWMTISLGSLLIEQMQNRDEGKQIPIEVQNQIEELLKADWSVDGKVEAGEALLDRISELPIRPDFPYHEPSDREGIAAAAAHNPEMAVSDNLAFLEDRVYGGWLGRAAGCLLGKPVEGWSSQMIRKYLESQGEWPLCDYFSMTVSDEIAAECNLKQLSPRLFREHMSGMVEDDDTNYTTVGLAVLTQYGRGFTPQQMGIFWMQNIPLLHLCTAERIAFLNMVAGIEPPESASYRNVCREWIGAQIRADAFGYVNPGKPAEAADMAWRDASISHVKNGIYGEMWVAAMIASAFVHDQPEQVILAGLNEIPAECRLSAAVRHIIELHHAGVTYDEAIADIRTRWNERIGHHWCHTISNAEIVCVGLLWGGLDFEKSLCYAVMPGLDTDCNGATVGSVLGVMLGAKALPDKWTNPLNDSLETGVAGYHHLRLSEMAAHTVKCIG